MKKVLFLGFIMLTAFSLPGMQNKPSQNNPFPLVQLVFAALCAVPGAIAYGCYLDVKEQWAKVPWNESLKGFFEDMYNNGSADEIKKD